MMRVSTDESLPVVGCSDGAVVIYESDAARIDDGCRYMTVNPAESDKRLHSFFHCSRNISLPRPIDVGSMFDTQDIDRPLVIFDFVDDSVRPASS